ncbi:MAG: hypothetical protein JXR63_09175 [Spirochaetales bacterium]|nr:hypothetical protein [Spirochaetales bacterium]
MKLEKFFKVIFNNLPAKIISILIAFILFLIYQNNSKVETTISLPINFIFNESLIPLESLDKIKNVDIKVRSDRVLSEDEKGDFYATVDLSHVTLNDIETQKKVKNAEIKILNRSERTDFEVIPSKTSVSLTLEKKVMKEVPVFVQSSGRSPYGYREEITTFPGSVVIEGPQSVLMEVDKIFTMPIDLADAKPKETLSLNSLLTLGTDNKFPNVKFAIDEVVVNVRLMEIIETRRIDNISITVSNNPPYLIPKYNDVKGSVAISGSLLELENISSSDFFLVIYADEVNKPGVYTLALNVVLPKKNIKVLDISPKSIDVTFVEKE